MGEIRLQNHVYAYRRQEGNSQLKVFIMEARQAFNFSETKAITRGPAMNLNVVFKNHFNLRSVYHPIMTTIDEQPLS